MSLLLALILLVQQPPDEAADRVLAAIAAGEVGERYDGYLDFVRPPGEDVRRAVGAVNLKRRALYRDLGQRRGIAPREVGLTAGCKLLARVAVGGAYQLADQAWRVRADGEQVALPSYCPSNEVR